MKDKRKNFMDAFRNDKVLATLTAEDRMEIWLTILQGSSDINTSTLGDLFSEYNIGEILTINRSQLKSILMETATKFGEDAVITELNSTTDDIHIEAPNGDCILTDEAQSLFNDAYGYYKTELFNAFNLEE